MAEDIPAFRHETARLVLRDWQDADWEPFWQETNTPAVMRWLGGVCDPAMRQAAQDRLLGYRREHGHTFWVVERRADGALLGFCGLKRSNQLGGPQGMMEVGWRLRKDAWGQGYAREAAAASLDLAFTRHGADEVIALTVPDYAPSWGLMLRLGMARRADLDFASADFDPASGLIIAYAIDRAAWVAARG
jgi:RimJ/RimL family protein N-acetyltransferase